MSQPVLRLVPSDRVDEAENVLRRIKCSEEAGAFETVRLKKGGSYIDTSSTASPIKNQNGEVVGTSDIVRDITERKQAEKMLQESKNIADALLNAPTETCLLTDTEERIFAINQARAQRLGKSVDELVGLRMVEYLPSETYRNKEDTRG